jgi:predicted RNA-binding Zn-ribbon protein involved in translation (DUF1610 family)
MADSSIKEWVSQECPQCGARLKVAPGATHARCAYCGNEIHLDNSIVDYPGQVDYEGDPDSGVERTVVDKTFGRRVLLPVIVIILSIFGALYGFVFVLQNSIKSVGDSASHSTGTSVEVVDPFEHIEMSITGVSGSGYVRFENECPNDWGVSLVSSSYGGVSNGDTIVVKLTQSSSGAEKFVLTTKEHEYLIEGRPEYSNDLSSLDDEAFANIMSVAVGEITYSNLAFYGFSDFTMGEPRYIGYIGLVKSDKSDSRLIMVFEVDTECKGVSKTLYVPVCFNDFVCTEDGYYSLGWTPMLSFTGSGVCKLNDDVWDSRVYGFESSEELRGALIMNMQLEWEVNDALTF